MMKKSRFSARRAVKIIDSEGFFRAVLIILAAEAAWIALTGRFPMAFDEDFHFGVIRIYAHHLSPFFSGQPAGADAFGAVARDPSYLYHYLMSFPYRLIDIFTSNQAAQVIILRFINLGLFLWAMTLYRRLLLKTGASRATVHLCLLILVLVPITPLLASQVNYDNLLLPLTALTLLLALKVQSRLYATKPALDLKGVFLLVIVGLLASLVKYAFLPVFAAIVVFLAVSFYRSKRFRSELIRAWRRLSLPAAALMIGLTLLSAGLFLQRYGVNIVKYHKPMVDCGEVLDYNHCRHFGPWYRDHYLISSNKHTDRSPLSYTQHWLYGMWLRSFFAVDGPATNFQTRGPLILPGATVIIAAVAGTAGFAASARRLWRRYDQNALWLFSLTTAVYVILLWADEYRSFLHTGKPVAINGRYLLPVLPLMLLLGALGVKSWLNRRPRLQIWFAAFVLIGFACGGGALTYILRSNDAWYWPNPAVRAVNHAVQRTVGPLTPGYKRPTQFLH